MARIKIDLDAWESASYPICTENVDLDNAEKALYDAMRMKYGYDDNGIEKFLKGKGSRHDVERFNEILCQEAEECVLDWGGVFYDL